MERGVMNEMISPVADIDIIRVTQLPVIEEHLRSIRPQVEELVTEATSMICTEETLQAVKTKRAELNARFTALEEMRKAVKRQIMAPYDSFEATYKSCVTELFRGADAELKGKISEIESDIKRRCENRLRAYHTELCTLHGVDYLPFDQAMELGGIKVTMASANAKTPRALMDKLGEVVASVACGADMIREMDDRDEIMAEYKKCLNVGKAVSTVQERHRRVEEERKAAEQREEARKRQDEAVAKVESAAPPVPVETPERVFERFTFTCLNVTKSQLIKVREFMKQEGIRYE